jgi:tetratricopeptide (TPR) repeat protein
LGAVSILFLCCGLSTYKRNLVWQTELDFWGDVIKKAPHKARGYNNYGIALAKKKRYQESINYFLRAIELDAHYADPYTNLAVAYGSLNMTDQEIAALRKAIAINPYSPEIYNNLGQALIKKCDLKNAEKALTVALKINPHYGKALYSLGNLYLLQNKLPEAWHYFKACCTQADFDTEAGYIAYGSSSLALDKLDEALFAYTKAVAINPDSYQAQYGLAGVYFKKQEYTNAEKIYTQLIRTHGHEDCLRFALAETYLFQGKAMQALEQYSIVKERTTAYPSVGIRIATCYELLGKRDKAYKELQTVLLQKEIPEDLKARAQKALAHMQQQAVRSHVFDDTTA